MMMKCLFMASCMYFTPCFVFGDVMEGLATSVLQRVCLDTDMYTVKGTLVMKYHLLVV